MRILPFILLVGLLGFKSDETPKVRDNYYTIPLKFLPALTTQMAEDTRRERDLMITKHDPERGYMALEKKGSKTDTRLQQYIRTDNRALICIETTTCSGKKCDNSFKIIEQQSGSWVDITTAVAPDVNPNLSKIRGLLKKAYKTAYGDLDKFESLGYDDDEALQKGLVWSIEHYHDEIYLKETYLPLKIYKLVWNKKKNTFDLEKAE